MTNDECQMTKEIRRTKLQGPTAGEAKAAEGSRTPRPVGESLGPRYSRSVVECGCPLPLSPPRVTSGPALINRVRVPKTKRCRGARSLIHNSQMTLVRGAEPQKPKP